MTDRELLKQALDALNKFDSGKRNHGMLWQVPVIEAIKARLTQPEPKPVGCITEVHTKTAYGGTVGIEPQMYGRLPVGTLLYTAPPKKEWVGLTDKEVVILAYQSQENECTAIRLAEQVLKEKNT